jgi:hypothetical protein
MARTIAVLSAGARLSDYLSLGVLNKVVPMPRVRAALEATGRASRRQRELPAQVVVYYVIALTLYMSVSYREVLRGLLEGLVWLFGPAARVTVAAKSSISAARTRLGWEPMKLLHDELVKPVAQAPTRGAWYRQWRLVSLDGTALAVPDTAANARAFGRPGASRGASAFPQVRFVSLVESGTHVLFGTALGAYREGELTLAEEVIPHLCPGMLCLADRNFFSFYLWNQARATGADLLWRVKKNLVLPCERRLPDGSYLSTIYATPKDRRHQRNGVRVRVIEYALEGVEEAEPLYRLLTTILDHEAAPASELAALYPERWEIETALDELKTHLRGGAHIVLRSKTPDLVRQEFWGFLLAHFAVRGLMHEAALAADEDPDRLSFTHAVRVIRRKLPQLAASPPSAVEGVSSGAAGGDPGGAGGLQPRPMHPARGQTQDEQLSPPPRELPPCNMLCNRADT